MLEIKGLHKTFGKLHVLKGINLHVKKGEVVAIIGPSGTGKSTLLRCINYLEKPNSGKIRINDSIVDSENVNPKAIRLLRQKSSMVFQNYCLFKNKTVLENVMMPMTLVRKIDKSIAYDEAIKLIEQVGLIDKINEYPSRLSGGQQQRIGIARALSAKPNVLLFDEPTSSLDPELVGGILELISEVAKNFECSMLIVTHEMNFAMNIANRIVFMDGGLIQEGGSPDELMYNSKFSKTQKFLNILS